MISVIIPAYNAAQYIEETLQSILNQTFQQFEIIIVDDGSTDDTLKILEKYSQNDSRIRVVQQQNGGSSKARNTGISLAKYDWIAPVDSDDILMPDRFEKQLAAAAQYPQVIGWGTYAVRITAEGKAYSAQETGPRTLEEFEQMRYQQGEMIVMPASSVLLRKDILQKVGGYKSATLEDLILLDEMADHGPLLVIPENLIHYRMHVSSKTGTFKRFRRQRVHYRYLKRKARKRAEGKPLVSLEDFLKAFNNSNPIARALSYIDDYSVYNFRLTAQHLGERKYRSLFKNATISFLLNPYYISMGLWAKLVLRKPISKQL